MGQGGRLIGPRTATGGADGLVSHAGVPSLAECAELSGLSAGLSPAISSVPQRRHDAGRTLAQIMLALADGATCLSDLSAFRAQRDMFGAVWSEATVWRTFRPMGSLEIGGIATTLAAELDRVWRPVLGDLAASCGLWLNSSGSRRENARGARESE
jgi:hypothetical protein